MNEERIKAKSLKLEKDEVICPNCNSILTVPEIFRVGPLMIILILISIFTENSGPIV